MISFLDLLDSQEDKEKFEQIYKKYSNLLFHVAMNRLNNRCEAEDCVQDTFLYIAKNFHKIGQIESSETRQYLATIVTGYAIKKFNRNSKIEFVSLEEYKNIQEANDLEFFDDYDAITVSEAIDKLDDESKVYLYLTYTYGYKSSEIAKMYGTSATAIRMRLSRIRKQLKEIIEEGEYNL